MKKFISFVVEKKKFGKRKDIIPLFKFPMFSVYGDRNLSDEEVNDILADEEKYKTLFAKARTAIGKLGFTKMHANVVLKNLSESVNRLTGKKNGVGGYASRNGKYMTLATNHLHLDENMMKSVEVIVHEWAHLWMFNNSKSFKEAVKEVFEKVFGGHYSETKYKEGDEHDAESFSDKDRKFENFYNSILGDEMTTKIYDNLMYVAVQAFATNADALWDASDFESSPSIISQEEFDALDVVKLKELVVQQLDQSFKEFNRKFDAEMRGKRYAPKNDVPWELPNLTVETMKTDGDPDMNKIVNDIVENLHYVIGNVVGDSESHKQDAKWAENDGEEYPPIDVDDIMTTQMQDNSAYRGAYGDNIYNLQYAMYHSYRDAWAKYDAIENNSDPYKTKKKGHLAKLYDWQGGGYGLSNSDEFWATAIDSFIKMKPAYKKEIIKLMRQR